LMNGKAPHTSLGFGSLLCCKHILPTRCSIQRNILVCRVENYHKIAIVGCGIAGISLCYYLCKLSAELQKPCHITVFDPCQPGSGGASRVAAGLLHPFSPSSKLLWNGLEAFRLATQVIRHVESQLGTNIIQNWGIMRLALTEKQHRQLEQAVVSFPHRVQLFQGVDLDHILGWNSSAISGLLLKDACTIHTGEYIRGLFQLCMQLGRVEWRPEIVRHVEDLKQTNEFQDIVFCTGADINFIGGISGHVSITRSFGRNFYYHQGETNLPLKVPIICGRYLIPGKTTFIAGATFEGDSCLSDQLAQDMQISDVQSRLDKLVPGIFNHLQFIHMDGAFRALPERTQLGSIPIIDQLGTSNKCNIWLYTGLGSRGILYHAWLSQQLAKAIVFHDANILPHQVRRKLSDDKIS